MSGVERMFIQFERLSTRFAEVFEHKGTYIIGSGDSALGADAWSLPITFDTHDRHLRTVRLGTDACVPFQSRHVFITGPDEQDHPCAYITSAETITIAIRIRCRFFLCSICVFPVVHWNHEWHFRQRSVRASRELCVSYSAGS